MHCLPQSYLAFGGIQSCSVVAGGVNPRKSGAGRKVGTKIAVELFEATGSGGEPLSMPPAAEGGGRRPALCAGHVQQPGGESPLCNLMEVKHE